jgi:putative nucleotidyltransferase with HDIG domain
VTAAGNATPVRVLVVDDEEPIRRQLSRFLADRGYATSVADSGAAALERLREVHPALMLLDVSMPGLPGTEVIPEALDIEPDLGIVMLSGAHDAPTVTVCLQRGALDYLTKPVDLETVARTLEKALRRRDTLAQERALAAWVKQEVRTRTDELQAAHRRERALAVGALEALVVALEAKSPYLAGHSTRVAEFAASMASQLGVSDDEVERLRLAGRLHDIGMIGIRERVLEKQGPLTDDEYAHVREHAAIGARILESMTHLGEVRAYVRGHHERWDGRGYPDRLAGEAIPVGARILHAAEVYDALTTDRPYQARLAPDAAVARMEELAGSVLDPAIVAALRTAVRRRTTLEFVNPGDDAAPAGG